MGAAARRVPGPQREGVGPAIQAKKRHLITPVALLTGVGHDPIRPHNNVFVSFQYRNGMNDKNRRKLSQVQKIFTPVTLRVSTGCGRSGHI
jgi:hypothetical protein|tara:strand:+ start:326 stop:598 length:273 start_codon:yes stop_codon:yes gene_type:complete